MLNDLTESTRDWVEALLIVAPFWISAIVLRLLWGRLISPWFKRSKNADLVLLIRPLRVLVVWALVLSGLNFGIQSLDYIEHNPNLGISVEKILSIAWTILAMVVAIRFLVGWFKYKAIKQLEDGEEFHDRVSTSQKLFTGLVIAIGALSILRIGGIDISPLLAGGAVGGIIIGLALQDSLSNVFAGLFLNIDRPMKEGELLKLDQGQEGFVEEVGWRYTKLRLLNDTLMVIPNNKFSQSTFVNMDRPRSDLTVVVSVVVNYGSDPDLVEEAVIEAAKEAQKKITPNENPIDPYVRWQTLGDKLVTLQVHMRTSQSSQQYRLTSECTRLIYKKFVDRGLVFPAPAAAPALVPPQQPTADLPGAPSQIRSEENPVIPDKQ
jgi:small-conductance mechanosensitive channel